MTKQSYLATARTKKPAYTATAYISLALAVCSVFIVGCHLNWLNSLHTFIKCFFLVNLEGNELLDYKTFCSIKENLDDLSLYDRVIPQWSVAQSLNLFMCAIGGFLLGYVLDQYGRKRTFQVGIFIDALGMGLTAGTYWTSSFPMFTAGRVLSGIALGAYLLVAPVYLQEIAMAKDKQLFSTFFGWAFNIGTLFIQILGIEKILGQYDRWIGMPFVIIGLIVVMAVLSIFAEETPDWATGRGDLKRAGKLARKLHGVDTTVGNDDQNEGDDQDDFDNSTATKNPTYWQNFAHLFKNKPTLKIVIFMTFGIMGWHNLNGTPVFILFSTSIFAISGFTNEMAGYLTIAMGCTAILASLTFTILVSRFNKRTMAILAMFLVTVYNILMTAFGRYPDIQALNILSIILIYLVVYTIQSTVFLIALMLPVLLVRPQYRSAATSFVVTAGWLSMFVATFIFPYVFKEIGSYSFLIYGSLSAIWLVWTWFRMVDPDGKDFDEIEEIFRKRKWYL